MRVILDTNVFLSALLSRAGAPAKLLEAWEQGKFTLVACPQLIEELLEVAARPFFRSRLIYGAAELFAAGIRDFSFYCEELPPDPPAPDEKDAFLLALAEASQADFLVTGDKALLSLKNHKSTRVVTAATMVESLKSHKTI